MPTKYLIITNNSLLTPYAKAKEDHFELISIEGNVRDVAFTVRDKMMNGYSLATDPLGGRLERPTPYLTAILKKNSDEEKHGDQILRIEYFVDSYCEHHDFLDNMEEKRRHDYQHMDTSIAKNACEALIVGR